MPFLPVSKDEMNALGWEYYDFLLISGDAYVDHPSFGHAIISRVLEAEGYRVAILPQPDWRTKDDFMAMGRPRYGVMISGGNLDSMVAHYTAAKKRRHEDLYSPGGNSGFRPDRCTIVYSGRVREAFPDIPIIIGGLEASLRRFAHYDYWDNKVRRSIIFDSRADLISFGMGERQTAEIANALASGIDIHDITWIPGTCYISAAAPGEATILPSFEEVSADKASYSEAAKIEYLNQDPLRGKALAQKHAERYVVQNPPAMPLTEKELDRVYELPYMREYHPMYESRGGIPALNEVRFSISMNRGCFGNCNFCSLNFHQGRIIQCRSRDSIVNEAKEMIKHPLFKGYIHDVGGPTANFTAPACEKQLKSGACENKRCLFPRPCKNIKADHSKYLDILRSLRKLEGVKKVFIRSGLRYDYLLSDQSDEFFRELCKYHISGQLRVAPEHISDNVLRIMGKPSAKVYREFSDKFYRLNDKQFLVPYLMSSHPGSTLKDAVELAVYLKENRLNPEQVQDFYPTPGTISTAMYYTGIHPLTGESVYVPKTQEEKAMQRALLQFKNPDNYRLVYKALTLAGREDLIGYSQNCLIKPTRKEKINETIRRKNSVPAHKGRAEKRGGGTGKKTGTGSNHSGR